MTKALPFTKAELKSAIKGVPALDDDAPETKFSAANQAKAEATA